MRDLWFCMAVFILVIQGIFNGLEKHKLTGWISVIGITIMVALRMLGVE